MKAAKFSERSRNDLLADKELRAKIAEIRGGATALETIIEQASDYRKRMLKRSLVGRHDPAGLTNNAKHLEALRGDLKIEKERLAFAEGELKALEMTPAREKERAANQEQLASVESARLAKDAAIQKTLDELRGLLAGRAELSAQMDGIGAALGIDTDFDDARFCGLLAAIPDDVLKESLRWSAWFNGKPLNAQTYVVRARALHLPETLAHPGIYHTLDLVELSDGESTPLVKSGQIVTLAAFEVASEDAEARGITVADLWAYDDHETVRADYEEKLDTAYTRSGHQRPKARAVAASQIY